MKKTESGMHEIKNKRRPRAVKIKKGGVRLRAKKRMSRTAKAIVTLCSALVLVFGVYGVCSAFFKETQRNTVDLNYGSPSVPVAEGEVYSLSADYAPVDIFARLNWKFSQQNLWYSEMHGTVDTVIQQSVTTYKQYDNGILISADLTESSLIKGASQFCYLKDKDRVIWRKPASKNYNGLDTEWQTGEPYNIMTIGGEHGFKATNGLPAYELSVYVIEEDTVKSTSAVTATEDGKFKITYELKPDTWQEEVDGVLTTKGATAYYINQMIFTGGLTTPPEFNAISVTFTFDKDWQVFQTDIEEKYSAKYGPIAAPCVSTSTTTYEYNTDKAYSDAYEEYFYRYAEGGVNNTPVVKELTALDCLAEGFGSVLTDPTVLDLDLTIGETLYHGIVDLDLSQADFTAFDVSALAAKAKLGALSLWVEEGNAYLNYGGLKFEVKLDELISLVKELTAESGAQTQPPETSEETEEGGGTEELLSALAGGEFTLADGKAELHSELPLLGLKIPVGFYFSIGEDNAISVEKVTAEISLGDDLPIKAQLGFGEEHLPDLSAAQKSEYVSLMPYVQELKELFSADVLHADISYKSEGITVSGGLDLRLADLSLAGEVQADVSLNGIELSKKVGLSYTDGALYLDLDGIKVQATLEEGIALLEQYVSLPELPEEGVLSGLDLGALINTLLSQEFAELFSSSEQNELRLAVKGSELLSAFGLEFALGDVTVSVGDGTLSATALGAEIGLTAGTDVALDTQGYTPILPYVQSLIKLFSNEDLVISLSYSSGNFTVSGEIALNLSSLKAAGEIVLGYGNAQKTLSVIYEGNTIYLDVEGLRVKAGVNEAVALVSSLTGAENDLDATALINKVLALNFGSVISLGEEDDTLTVLLAGTELLRALGLEFNLGNITLSINDESVKAEAEDFGVAITVKAGQSFEPNTNDYIDIVDYATTIAQMIKGGYLTAEVSYQSGDLAVTGTIQLAIETLKVQGTLTLKYKEASQTVNVIYGDNVIYLELGGMKVSAGVNEAVALIGEFITLPAGDSQEKDLIEELLSLDFADIFTLTEDNDTLFLAITGTELLRALGLEFNLGNITLSVDNDSIKAEAEDLGVSITVKAGQSFEPNTDDYIDIVDYATTIAQMIKGGYLSAEVSYTSGDLAVTGTIQLAIETLKVQGELTLKYKGASQTVNVIYGDNVIYLELGGMKVSAGVNEAVALIGEFITLPAGDSQEKDLIEELLSLDFADIFTLTEENNTLSLAIAGTELLRALGLEFNLGQVTLSVDSDSVKAEATDLGVSVTVKTGNHFEPNTDNYIDIVDYATTIAQMIKGGYLSAEVTYTSGDLSVSGTIQLAIETLKVQGTLTLKYKEASQTVNVIYGDNVIYLELGGMKVSAGVNEAVALIGEFVDLPTGDSQEKDLIEELLSLDFADIFTLTEENDTLSLAIAGTELLRALGLEFELGNVTLSINDESVKAEAETLGVAITVKAGQSFKPNTNGYIDIVDYATTIAKMIKGGYLSAEVTYTSGDLSVSGTIQLAIETLKVQATLSLKYKGASQTVNVIYGDNVVYLELGGMKVSAGVNEAVALIGEFITLPTGDSQEKDLIEELLSLNFSEVFTLTEENNTLSLAIAGTELLKAFGLKFELGNVTLSVDSDSVKAKAETLGVAITVKAGSHFEPNTNGYIDIVDYATTIAKMIKGGYLTAEVSYTSGDLAVTGTIQLAIETLKVQGTLTLKYKEASQTVNVIYGDNVIYLELGGMKVSAGVNEAVALIGEFITLTTGDGQEKDLIEELLSLNFADIFTLTEKNDTLSLAITGTELLRALGLEFELGNVTLSINDESVKAEATDLGVSVTVKTGNHFEPNTNGYIDIVDYATTIAKMIKGGYLSAEVTYTSGDLSVSGTIHLAIDSLKVQGELTLKYKEASQTVNVIYGDNVIYLELGGMKVSAGVNEAVALIGEFITLPAGDSQEKDLIEELLRLNFSDVFTLTEENDTLSLAIAGTELLRALGLEFNLGQVTLSVDSDSVKAVAEDLGVSITVKAGQSFEPDTNDYIDIVDYATTIAQMIKGGYLSAEVTYTSGDLAVTGTIQLAIETLKVQGELTLKYKGASQTVNVIYGDNVIYLELGGMKVSAGVNEAVALIGEFITLPAGDSEEKDLIEELLSLNFSDIFTLTEKENTLSLAITGTELLRALGLEFNLGNVTLSVDSDSVKAEATDLGVSITVKAGSYFEPDTNDYIDIVDYATTVAQMIKGGYLTAEVSYTSGDLSVSGTIQLAIETLKVQGTLTLKYKEASQTVNVIYGDSVIYLELGGMKVSAGMNEAVALIGEFISLPTGDSQEKDLIEELLSLNFSEVFTLTEENDTLSLAIAGTELLRALGLEFELGNVTLSIDDENVKAEAEDLGVSITVKAGQPFEPNTNDYIDIVDYATTVAQMIKGGYLSAEVSYTSGDLSVSGTIDLAIETLKVQGTLTLKYKGASQTINVIYGDNVVYLELGGMKVSAGVNEAVALIGEFITLPAGDSSEKDLIEELLSLNFADIFTLTEENNTLSLAITGTELLRALGLEFELGNVTLSINDESVKAEAEDLGVEITVKAGNHFEPNTDDYIDIVDYATTVAQMIKGGYLSAEVSYTSGDLSVSGTIQLAIETLKVQATLSLNYGGTALKQLGVVYAGDVLYLTVYDENPEESLKVSLGVKEAIALVTSLMGTGSGTEESSLIEKLLSLDLRTLIPVFEEAESGDKLKLAVAGSELLKAFGLSDEEIPLGNLCIEIGADGISATLSAGKEEQHKVELSVTGGADFPVALEGYFDLTPLLGNIQTILTDKAISLCGRISLAIDDLEIDVEIENAVLSFAKGLKLYLHASLCLQQKAMLDVYLSYDEAAKTVKLACGTFGAEIVFTELGSLEEAVLNVYESLRAVVQDMLVDSSKNPLPEIKSFDDLAGLFSDASAGGTTLPDWTEIVQSLVFNTTPTSISAAYGKLFARIFRPSEHGFLAVELGGSIGSHEFPLEGALYLGNAEHAEEDGSVLFPEMPDVVYYGVDDFVALVGYFGSAIDLLNTTDLTLTFNGTVTSPDTETMTYPDHVKYAIDASMSTHRGASNLIHLDVDGKNLWVDTDVFAHASINITAKGSLQETAPAGSEEDGSLFIDLFILDLDQNGKQDNMLDFYVTLSQFGPVGSDVAGYDPVRLYAPSGEILSLLSSALPMLGIDADILNNYMIEKWLSLENVAQLKAFGGIVSPLLSGLLGGAETSKTPEVPEAPAESETPAEPAHIEDYLVALTFGAEELSVVLNSEKLYGIEGLENVKATLTKYADSTAEDGSRIYGKFRSLNLLNIYDKTGKLNTSLTGTIDYDTVTPDVPSGTYQSFLGAEKLLLAIVKSATHGVNEEGEIVSGEQEPHSYAVNKYFYIDGTVNAHLSILNIITADINIRLIALSVTVDEEGKLGINLRLEYDAVNVGALVAINGDSKVDITIKEGMVYIKRVQTSYYEEVFLNVEKKTYVAGSEPTLYRAMPLENFTGDILGQLGFILNFGSLITDNLKPNEDSGTTTADKIDFGTRLSDVLRSYTFTEETKDEKGDIVTPASWNLVLNGDALVKGILGDITVTLSEDKDGYIRNVTAETKVVSVITANVALRWRNPGGKMEEGTSDRTNDVAATLKQAMDARLKKVNWKETTYLEGQLTTVSYYVTGVEDPVGTQEVVFDPTTGESFASLSYPSLDRYMEREGYEGYTPEWDKPKKIEPDLKVYAKYRPNEYDLTFVSELPIADTEELGYEEQYDEAQNKWLYTIHWTYGTPIELPFGRNNEKYIDYFTCSEGGQHTDSNLSLHIYTQKEITYTAHWEYIDYTVEFVSDGNVVETRTGHFGDEVGVPAKNPEKTGYTFEGWENAPETFGGNVRVNAIYKPNTYTVTLLSEHDLSGNLGDEFVFVARDDGMFEWKLQFVYDETYLLPMNIKTEDGAFIFNGVTANGETYRDVLPNVLNETVFTVVWEEVGVDVRFADEDGTLFGGIPARNKKVNSKFTAEELPAVPEKKGYTGEWGIDLETYTVPAEGDVIKAVYTPIEYTIYEYSFKYIEGFEAVHGDYDSEGVKGNVYWRKIYKYTYGSTPHKLTLGENEKVVGYDFEGYYTERFGQGKKIVSNQIDDEMISDIFNFNVGDSTEEGLAGKNVLYANWVDNSVEVHLYSDFDFVGKEGSDHDGFYKSLVKMENDYNIENEEVVPTTKSGIRRLGWWYQDPETGWRLIKDVEEFRNYDNRIQATVKLFAIWIEEIKVTITNFYTNGLLGGSQYNISGTVAGGKPIGTNSSAIYDALTIQPKANGYYVLYNTDGSKSDAPGGSENIEISYTDDSALGTFHKEKMNSGTFRDTLGASAADFGGLLLKMEFTAGDTTLALYDGDVVSLQTYSVRYLNEAGEEIDGGVKDGVRIAFHGKLNVDKVDYDFDSIDIDPVTLKDLFPEGIPVPEKRGYSGVWSKDENTEVTGSLEIRPVYTVNKYDVVFVSDEQVGKDWVSDGDYGYKYVYRTQLEYGATIYFLCLGEQIGDPYTVTDKTNVVNLPEKKKFNGEIEGEWEAAIDEKGATFTVVFDLDTVNYHSAVAFDYNGISTTDVTEQFNAETKPEGYTFLTPTAEGYIFLGWFEQTASGWRQATTVTPTADGEKLVKNVEALWVRVGTVVVGGNRDDDFWRTKSTHNINATVNDLEFFGAPAEILKIDIAFRFWADKNVSYSATNNESSQKYSDQSIGSMQLSHSASIQKTGTFGNCRMSYGHAAVTITIKDGSGNVLKELSGETLHGYVQY